MRTAEDLILVVITLFLNVTQQIRMYRTVVHKKRPRHENEHSPTFSGEVKNAWN
jgi:hypothetical protein